MKHINFWLEFSTHRIVFYKCNKNKNCRPLIYLIVKNQWKAEGKGEREE